MMMKQKAKSIWAAILCLALLFTELPFTQLSSVGTALAEEEESLQGTVPAEEGELLQGTVLTEEEAEAEFLGAGEPSVSFTSDGVIRRFTLSSMKSGMLEGLDEAVYYSAEQKTFTLVKNLKANVSFQGGVQCRFEFLRGYMLYGTEDTSVVKIAKNCKVQMDGTGIIDSMKDQINDEGGLIYNRGEVSIENLYLRAPDVGGTVTVSYDGGGLSNYGTAELKNVEIRGLRANGNGGAICNRGNLVLNKVKISSCTADEKGKEIYNAPGGTITIAGKLDGTEKLINAGKLCCEGTPALDRVVNVPVENTSAGTVESGAFSNTVSGLNTQTAGSKVQFVFTVNGGGQYLLAAGTGILSALKQHASVMKAVFPDDGGRDVTETDQVDPLNLKTRRVTATVGVTVSFDTGYEKKLEDRMVEMGSRIEKPELTRDGYWLTGWYKDVSLTQEFDFTKPVTENVKLYAGWIQKTVVPVWVSFESNGGTAVDNQLVFAGEKATRPVDPTRENYLFRGWYKDAECRNAYNFEDPVVASLKLYAGWQLKPVIKVTVTFVPGNGSAETTETVLLNDPVKKPADPVRYGYTFNGWYRDAACTNRWDFTRGVTADMSLYAGWTPLKRYRVSFESNEGTAVAAQSVMEGEKAVKPEDPVKEYNRFIGWCTDKDCSVLYDFNTPVSRAMTLYALWLPEAVVPVKVTFDTDGGSAVSQQVLLAGDLAAKPEDPVKENYIFSGWYTEKEGVTRFDFNTAINQDMTLYAGWVLTPVVPVRVTFEKGDGSKPEVQTILRNEKAAEPEAPVRREYFFTGWYSDQKCTKRWNFSTAVEESITLYAGWKAKKQLTVTFDSLGGSAIASKTVLEQDPVEEPAERPTNAGFLFYGWCTDAACRETYDFTTPVTADLTLYARWIRKAVIPVKVDFETNGGTEIGGQVLAQGDKAVRPADPVREQYLFAGWCSDAELKNTFDFNTAITTDTVLYARWLFKPVTKAVVTFEYQNGQPSGQETVLIGEPVAVPEDPVRYGFTFCGWYRDKGCTELWDFTRGVSADMSLYAGWNPLPRYTVSFESNGGTAVPSQTVMETEKAVKPTDPARTSYQFIGWCTDKECRNLYDFDTAVSGDLKLYALWLLPSVITVKVSFDSDGGSAVPQQVLIRGDKAAEPAEPVKKNHTFGGWCTDKEGKNRFDFNTEITQDIKLYASWILAPVIAVHVSFEKGDGSTPEVQTLFRKEKAVEPEDPVRREYFFTGWYSDQKCTKRWNFSTAVEEDITLYAGWKAKRQFTVTFDSLGGSAIASKTVLEQDPVEEPAEKPAKEGWLFFGWCTDASCTETYDFETPVTGDKTLYARWIRKAVIPVRVNFETNGGTKIGGQVLAWGEKAVKPADPSREQHLFSGWYTDAALENAFDFDTPITEDTVLYAGWLFKPVTKATVTFEYQNGQPSGQKTVLTGDPVAEPEEEPVRAGYFFLGWFKDPECTVLWDFSTPIISDCSIYAGWRAKEKYTVSFETLGGSAVASQEVLELDTAVKPAQDPVKTLGDVVYQFCGWCVDEEGLWLYDFGTPVTGDLKLYARWMEPAVVPVTVEFDSAGGSAVRTQIVASGSNAVRPSNPTRTGYTFIAWLKDGVEYLFNTPVTENIRLAARWLMNAVIPVWLHFDSCGGSSVSSVIVASGSNAAKPEKEPVKARNRFTGWFEDKSCTKKFDFDNTLLTESKTLYAGWQEVSRYSFTFDSCGGTAVPGQTVYEGECAEKPENPTRDGYFFLFWCIDAAYTEVYDFSAPLTANRTVYAKWIPKTADTVTVSFESNGGTAVESQKVIRGEKAVKPVDPKRTAYTFKGWFTDAGCTAGYDFSAKVTGDLKLYAGWSYNGGGGGGGGGGSSSGSAASRTTMEAFLANGQKYGTWKQNAKGWWIEKTDGTWPANEWVQCTWNGILNWYFFTAEGYMASGFITGADGRRYYLHTAATGSAGAMATGWVEIEKKWYYFNQVSDGTKGAMAVNTTTPDGYKVGKDGAWTGK